MNSQNFEQEITQTLEFCLSKMSKKLKQHFNPNDKPSLHLLQQYRSTISTYRSWLKKACAVVKNQVNKIKQNESSSPKSQSNNIIKQAMQDVLDQFPKSKQNESMAKLNHQSSGLLYRFG